MRLLYIDIDTLRSDHLGCYGYHRNTSPNIDAIAKGGVRFENCFVSDAPCLPSRSGSFTGRFGIHTGVINHGGSNADPYPEGAARGFQDSEELDSFPMVLRKNGIYTASVSSFPERHGAWWFNAGFRETYNPGKYGLENADEVFPLAFNWLEKNGKTDNWFLHINCWDPHAPYDHPANFGRPFENDPPPAWITEEKIKRDYGSYGPHSACDLYEWDDQNQCPWAWKDLPKGIKSLADYKKWIDGYDTGIRYADYYVGKTAELLNKLGIYDETIVMLSSDHGENQGELNIYGDHHTADNITSRVPFIIKWPGRIKPGIESGLHYQADIFATILELSGFKIPDRWDGTSFADSFKNNKKNSRNYLVISNCAWSCQRSVVFNDRLLIKTYHTGLKHFPEIMLFNIKEDPHELNNLAKKEPGMVKEGLKYLEEWHESMMKTSTTGIDPMDTVIEEGGPYHTKGFLKSYCKRLRETGREHCAVLLEKYRGEPIKDDDSPASHRDAEAVGV